MATTTEQRAIWSRRLNQMRGPGARRARKGKPSQSLAPLLARLPKGSTIIDVGCGESGDRNVAHKQGFIAFGVDVFAPNGSHKRFIQADALSLPFADNSIDGITNHAMIALVSPFDRFGLYQEVARVLKPEGLFSITPYPLADGFSVSNTIEADRIYYAGLHKVRTGLYIKCSESNCKEHPDPDSFAAIVLGCERIDTNPDFCRIAPLLIGWIAKGGSFKKTVEFTGCDPDYLHFILHRLVDCKMFDAERGTLDIPWMTYFTEDKVEEGNIALMCDVLCIEGHVERSYEGGSKEPLYRAVREAK